MQRQFQNFYGRAWGVEKSFLVEMESAVRAGHAFAVAEPRGLQSRSARGGIAVLPLLGVLFQRANFLTEFFGGTSLDRFAGEFRLAVQNPGVSAIVIEVDSPGGEVSGVPELAAEILAARSKKKIVAVANSFAASAAHWIASAASEFVASPSAKVGSIGVYALHLDFSKAMAVSGIKPTFISAGKFKTAGNELEPLTAEAAAATQKIVDSFYEMFVRDVARGRGVTMKAVRSGFGEGRVVLAAEARQLGMVDRVATLDEVIAGLSSGKNKSLSASASASARAANENARARLRLQQIS